MNWISSHEFQNPSSVLSYAWAHQYGLSTVGGADYDDPDHDGMNNWQEWRCLTNPTNAASVLRVVSALPAGTNVNVTWQSVLGVNYLLERSTNVAVPLFSPLATNLLGQALTTTYTDTNAASLPRGLYRVGVGN